MNESIAAAQDKLKAVEEVLAHPGYALLKKEIERQRDEGTRACRDVKRPQSERDSGAGKSEMGDNLLEYLPQLAKSLEATLTRKRATSRNRQ